MTYVITYGPLDAEAQLSCETAQEALAILRGLADRGEVSVMVASYQNADEALNSLIVLATAERTRRKRHETAQGSQLLN